MKRLLSILTVLMCLAFSAKADREGWSEEQLAEFTAQPVFELRPERLSVEDFIDLTLKLA